MESIDTVTNEHCIEQTRPREACGVFGICNHPLAPHITYLGLYALQHRGQEAAGIVSSNGSDMTIRKGMGLVSEVFDLEKMNELKGNIAIGHVRYSTTGDSLFENAQPLVVSCAKGEIAIGHNGNLVNSKQLQDMLEQHGSIFQTTVDSEILLHLIARSTKKTREEALIDCLLQIRGAYSLVILWGEEIIGVRDPQGFRPLCIGQLDGAYILSSESCALGLSGATYVRDVEPGEVV
ncbi:MAG: class II glutamine amidotransferase, partial [Chlamydiota bacterium]|nr:class II glutamine amidotransferase [Chlamydiota bacterium]